MRTIIISTIIALLASVAIPLQAQSAQPTEAELNSVQTDVGKSIIVGNNAFVVQLTRATQDPGSKEITYNFSITSNITSDRVEITWDLIGVSEPLREKYKRLTIEKGQKIDEQFVIKPRFVGRTELRVELRSVAAGVDYIAAARDQFYSNDVHEIIPHSSDYVNAKRLYDVRNVVIIGVVILAIGIMAWMVYNFFQKWLAQGK